MQWWSSIDTHSPDRATDIRYFCTGAGIYDLILPAVDCLKSLNSMSRAYFEKYLYSRLHQLSSRSYNRTQWEKTAWCKQRMSLDGLGLGGQTISMTKNRTLLTWFYHVNRVRGLWADTAAVSVTGFRHMSGPYSPRQGYDLQPVKNGKWIFYWKPAVCNWSQ